MNIGNIFITLYVLWHFNNYGTPEYLYLLYQKFYFLIQKQYEKQSEKLKKESIVEEKVDIIIKKPPVKYEDKYLEDIRKMDKDYVFTEEEKLIKLNKTNEIFNVLLKEKREKSEICKKKVTEIYKKIEEYKNSDDIHCLINDNVEDEMDFSLCVTKEDIIKKLEKDIQDMTNDFIAKADKILENKEKEIIMKNEDKIKYITTNQHYCVNCKQLLGLEQRHRMGLGYL